ncbi:DNA topoisomerase IV subunit A [Herbiconiux sp. CPCC 205763]|uniref:DNA topoisomerase (ATP-hydrolyzing) n=1 Tax=Herbiconiux aconitum TaxID=2970913 RepID=A0ABT2GTL2_9MICO|nr:DNA topoisomerase IV subunit A [Herbiconiux aconitum]MCS5719561.1 DNA topoisomerase IV subunit A [Herbiconiux aconitum]
MTAATNDPTSTDSGTGAEKILDVDVSTEMQDSFLEYAYSVIYSRALPDARDGLKPVQRRILYMMSDMGLRPDRGHVKSARVVGEVMGKLHPHGDTAIYDALVRLAQSWTMRVPLIDGHGNFGSLDDGPAASRYTEARLDQVAMAMVEGLDEDVIDFVPNYDNQLVQPDVLPSAIPNLLVNGASGIAVGMATNMAPHNLIEVVAGARYLIEHPDATLDDLMSFIPGPDLPGGGTIVGLAGVRDAYETGRGSFKTRAKVSIETLSARKTGLVVTELPYLVGPEKVIAKIKDGVTSKKIQGISDVTDLTDRTHGLRLVIGIKTGFNPEAVLEQLFKLTPLEDSFNINNVALVDGGPLTLGLRDLLVVYVNHRIDVVTRRTRYRLDRRRERLHLVEGLLIAILDIDEVIQVIRTSDDTDQARVRLIDVFELSVLQADYILELRLRRLTRFSRIELEAERDKLREEIAQLEALLADPALIRATVSNELDEVAEKFGTPRRTLLTEARPSLATTSKKAQPVLEVADVPCTVYLSTTGRVVRVDREESDEERGDGPAVNMRRSKHDAIRSQVDTTRRSEVGAITDTGRLIRMPVMDLPAVPANSVQLGAGVKVGDYLAIDSKREKIVGLVSLSSSVPIALGTAQGVVKRVTAGAYPPRPDFEVIALKPGDSVVGVAQHAEEDELVFITSDAQLLRFFQASVRPQGVAAGGMAGINLGAGATVIWFGSVPDGDDAVVVTVSGSTSTLAGTDAGSGKVSDFAEFPPKGRATGGVRAHRFLKGEDVLTAAWAGRAPALAVGTDGSARTLPDVGAKRDASGVALGGVVGSIGATRI